MPKKSETVQKKKHYTTPGGVSKIAYHNKKYAKQHCASCGAKLKGIPTSKSVAKSARVPNRPYAGVYCSSCTRLFLRNKLSKVIQ